MSANKTFAKPGGSTTMELMYAVFANASGSFHWRCEYLRLPIGPAPGEARIVIPAPANVDEVTSESIFMQKSGPAGKIKIGTQVTVKKRSGLGKTTPLFKGFVTVIEHNKDLDSLIVTAEDHRWLMQDVRISGRWIMTPDDENQGPHFQEGWPCHFNPGGRPNMLIYGGDPYFAPYPDYGLEDNFAAEAGTDSVQVGIGSSAEEGIAAYWSLEMILKYLRNFHGPDAGSFWGSQAANFGYLSKVPSSVRWPSYAFADVDEDAGTNFDRGIGQNNGRSGSGRKGRDINLEGFALMDALHLLLSTAGGYTVTLDFSGFYPTIGLANTYFTSKSQSTPIYMWTNGDLTNLTGAIITGGNFIEDGRDYRSSVTVKGALPMIETRVSTETEELEFAHSDERFELWKTLAAGNDVVDPVFGTIESIDGEGNPSSLTFEQANAIYPDVMTTFRIKSSWAMETGTIYSGYPRAPIARPPWPVGLSMMTDAGANDFAGLREKLYVEIKIGGTWTYCVQFDGMEIMDNGIIHIPVHREFSAPYNRKVWKWANDPFDVVDGKVDIELNDVRINLAVPFDHSLSGSAFSGNDRFTSGGSTTVSSNPDAARISQSLIRREVIDAGNLYVQEMRKDSWPRPESMGYPQANDKKDSGTGLIRNDDTLTIAHAVKRMREVNRLYKGGALRMDGVLATGNRPGKAVDRIIRNGTGGVTGSWKVNAVINAVVFQCKGDKVNDVFTQIEFT